MIGGDLSCLRSVDEVARAITLGATALAAIEEVAPLLLARRPEYTDAQLAALRVAVDARRRAGISWNWIEQAGHTVPDFTCGNWPTICNVRWRDRRPGIPVFHAFTCTRLPSHTGRHAAAAYGRVVAVWAGDRS